MIKAVFFDLDGTLFDRDATLARILAWQVRAFSSDIAAERADDFRARVTALDEHGHRDKREVYTTIAPEFGLGPAVVEQLIATFWAEYPRHCRPGAGVIDTLSELRKRGTHLGIVTNGTATAQNAAIDALAIREFMDAILVSESEGIRKPGPEIFRRAAARAGAEPCECCFVGDHPIVDVAGAEAAGFMGIWKRTPYWEPAVPCTTIDAISEVLALV